MNRIKIGSFQRRITVFPCIFKLWEEILQRVLQHVNSGLNIMKLALVIQMSKSMVRIKEIIKMTKTMCMYVSMRHIAFFIIVN